MEKKTKETANYRLPVQCCANCAGSYRSTYDDAMCEFLKSGTSVDLGGICDIWSPDAMIQVEREYEG